MNDNNKEDPKPAPYSPSDTLEHEAVDILNYILDDRIKSHIDSRDKTPNHDGFLEITTEEGEPTGRINVQVKKLPDRFRDDPKKQVKPRIFHIDSHLGIHS